MVQYKIHTDKTGLDVLLANELVARRPRKLAEGAAIIRAQGTKFGYVIGVPDPADVPLVADILAEWGISHNR